MKKYNDKAEKELIKSIDNEEWISVKNPAELKKMFKSAARTTLIKDQRMNIRIAKRDIQSLKAKALEEGMPYQTLVSSILHKYITGKLTEKQM
ncbi:MAG: antitoxin [Spirochaetes bacterium]|nr:antitoxin [Spirochaetota bacterium]